MEKTKTVYITRNELLKNVPMVLCNNITNIDENFVEDNMKLFFIECEYCDGVGDIEGGKQCEDCGGTGEHELEPYQFYIASLTDYDKKQFEAYGVHYGYSEALEVDIIPIYDFGTSWSAFSYSKEVPLDYQLAYNETLKCTTPY